MYFKEGEDTGCLPGGLQRLAHRWDSLKSQPPPPPPPPPPPSLLPLPLPPLLPQDSGEALLDRMRASRAQGGAPAAAAAPRVQELTPAEAAKDGGNRAFKRGEWQEAVAHYSRWAGVELAGGEGRCICWAACWHDA